MDSRSKTINLVPFLTVILSIVIIHSILLIDIFCLSSNTDNQVAKAFSWLRFKLIDFICYFLYLRIILMTSEYIFLSSTSEIYEFDTSKTADVISHIASKIVLIVCLSLPVIVLYLFFVYTQNFDSKNRSLLTEFISGLKNVKWARFYIITLLMRRISFLFIIVYISKMRTESIFMVRSLFFKSSTSLLL